MTFTLGVTIYFLVCMIASTMLYGETSKIGRTSLVVPTIAFALGLPALNGVIPR